MPRDGRSHVARRLPRRKAQKACSGNAHHLHQRFVPPWSGRCEVYGEVPREAAASSARVPVSLSPRGLGRTVAIVHHLRTAYRAPPCLHPAPSSRRCDRGLRLSVAAWLPRSCFMDGVRCCRRHGTLPIRQTLPDSVTCCPSLCADDSRCMCCSRISSVAGILLRSRPALHEAGGARWSAEALAWAQAHAFTIAGVASSP